MPLFYLFGLLHSLKDGAGACHWCQQLHGQPPTTAHGGRGAEPSEKSSRLSNRTWNWWFKFFSKSLKKNNPIESWDGQQSLTKYHILIYVSTGLLNHQPENDYCCRSLSLPGWCWSASDGESDRCSGYRLFLVVLLQKLRKLNWTELMCFFCGFCGKRLWKFQILKATDAKVDTVSLQEVHPLYQPKERPSWSRRITVL